MAADLPAVSWWGMLTIGAVVAFVIGFAIWFEVALAEYDQERGP